MPFVPGLANDVFLSYSHLDNQAVSGEGWVGELHRRLQIELDEQLGERAQVWRDKRLGAADDFARSLDRHVRDAAVLIAIVSPAYLNSRWCDRELTAFVDGTSRSGDLWIQSKCRAIKVVKWPAEGDSHRERVLPETLGIEFFDTDRDSGRHYDLMPDSSRYQRLLTDLAHDICFVLRGMRKARTVYLGAAPPTLMTQRRKVSQELEAQHYRVLATEPDAPSDANEVVRRAVRESALSILFVERQPEGGGAPSTALAETERDAAAGAGVRQIVVVREGPGSGTETWREINSAVKQAEVEILVDPATHALKETVLENLRRPRDASPVSRLVRVYLICDRSDHPLLQSNRARRLRDHLLQLGFEVKVPLAEGSDPSEFSRDNRVKLRTCDGVLLYWGGSRQSWFEERLVELTQALGWRRGRAFAASAAYVGDPASVVKENYETREVDELIKQFEKLDVGDTRLTRFIARLGQTP